ncbi:hypothetical protein M9Y10_000944 [Tritrichomonas musculus]|uniref:Uncharacterized protein n=1 Tax=Tritrichomonas musculus TaxID=1915356 RepID=A0ABR2L7B2_9EUKA
MEAINYKLDNQAGVQAVIEPDGIWTKIGDKIEKHFFREKLNEKWFDSENRKAKLSMSGNFLYLIDNGVLHLLTLTADKDNEVYDDNLTLLDEGTKFSDAVFSYEETILYALAYKSNRIILFSLLPPKRIKEFIFQWNYYGTSLQIMILRPSENIKSTNAFLIESEGQSNTETIFYYFPTDYSNNPCQKIILQPIEEKKESLFIKPDVFEDNDDDDKSDEVYTPKKKEDVPQVLYKKAKQIQKYEDDLKVRLKDVKGKLNALDQRHEYLKSKSDEIRARFEFLLTRIQRLVEKADSGRLLARISDAQQEHQNLLNRLADHREIPYHLLGDDIIYEFRSLQNMFYMIQNKIDNMK